MKRDKRGRCVFVLGTVLSVLLACPHVLALNPALDINQYSHHAWKISDGFAKGVINSITQTPEGYLWLATDFGLTRFDGMRNVEWTPPAGQRLPSNDITQVLATRDGTLWIGTRNGLASWKDGKLVRYAELENQQIARLMEDRSGSLWVGTFATPTAVLCEIRSGSVHCDGQDGVFGTGVFGLCDCGGEFWAGTMTGLWRWRPGPAKQYREFRPQNHAIDLIEGGEGSLLALTRAGVIRFRDGKAEPFAVEAGGRLLTAKLLRDRDGGLWIPTLGQGLLHVHNGKTDSFLTPDGLSDDYVHSLFEDREGNIWAGTAGGLDRFREFAVPTTFLRRGVSGTAILSALSVRDGSVWLSTGDGLSRWYNGQLTIYRKPAGRSITPGTQLPGVREVEDGGLPDNRTGGLFEDSRGRIWVSTAHGMAYFEAGGFVPLRLPTVVVFSIAEEGGGNLWISDQDSGLFRVLDGRVVDHIPWAKLSLGDVATALAGDRNESGLWLGFLRGGVSYFKDGQVRASYTSGLGEGRVHNLRLDREDTLWAATEGGLSRLKDGRMATLSRRNGLPCGGVHWSIEDDAHSLWLGLSCGLASIARAELNAWAADPNHAVKATLFDSSDGVKTYAGPVGLNPRVAKASDGKLWFINYPGVGVFDPQHLPTNTVAPPVEIEKIVAEGKKYWDNLSGGAPSNPHLPPLVRDLAIDYTALSLVAPEKVRFRYKLEGHDLDWREDVENRRQVTYNDLPPRHYRFRVQACNNSGVWNEAGASFDFSIAPKFYQTPWFMVFCVVAFLALLWGIHQLRLLHLKREFNVRLEGRVSERTRVARDLHDTLLQSFQGVLLKFSALSYLIPERPDVQETLEGVVEQARKAITEGRDAVQGLRSSSLLDTDLVHSITTLGEALAMEPSPKITGPNRPEFRVQVEGKSREMPPLLRDEVYRIAGEGLRNAFRHAQARHIEVEIRYEQRQFRLRVRDDGKGINPQVLEAGSRDGHHGLPGMSERAQSVRGQLAIWSEPDSGTEIELTIPASFAYTKSAPAPRSMSSGKEGG
jgi:signal transduction histidine kinase/ligand-binding sensor domain-containing protein